MKNPTIISIDPGAKTLGAISEERRRYDSALPRIVSTIAVTPRLKDSLNFLTGISTPAVSGTSGRVFFLRFVSSALMAASAILLWISGGDIWLAVPLSIMAGSLLLGFATRILSTVSVGYFLVAALQGILDIPTCALMGFAGLVFLVSGPGIYSLDQCLRRSIFRNSLRRRRNSRNSVRRNTRLDYKSYSRIC